MGFGGVDVAAVGLAIGQGDRHIFVGMIAIRYQKYGIDVVPPFPGFDRDLGRMQWDYAAITDIEATLRAFGNHLRSLPQMIHFDATENAAADESPDREDQKIAAQAAFPMALGHRSGGDLGEFIRGQGRDREGGVKTSDRGCG
jgi:hypothetical protein